MLKLMPLLISFSILNFLAHTSTFSNLYHQHFVNFCLQEYNLEDEDTSSDVCSRENCDSLTCGRVLNLDILRTFGFLEKKPIEYSGWFHRHSRRDFNSHILIIKLCVRCQMSNSYWIGIPPSSLFNAAIILLIAVLLSVTNIEGLFPSFLRSIRHLFAAIGSIDKDPLETWL